MDLMAVRVDVKLKLSETPSQMCWQ